MFLQNLGEPNKEEKGGTKKKVKVEKTNWTRRGDAVLLKRVTLLVPRPSKMWKTKFRLKQLKRVSWRHGIVVRKKTGTWSWCGSR